MAAAIALPAERQPAERHPAEVDTVARSDNLENLGVFWNQTVAHAGQQVRLPGPAGVRNDCRHAGQFSRVVVDPMNGMWT